MTTSTTIHPSAWSALILLCQEFLVKGGRMDAISDEGQEAFVTDIEEAFDALTSYTYITIGQED